MQPAHVGSPLINGRDKNAIPHAVLSALPSDPTERIELSNRICSLALSDVVTQFQTKTVELQETLAKRDTQILSFQQRIGELESEVQRARAEASISLQEQNKLRAERQALVDAVKRLHRDNAKLESFKRNLLQSLQNNEEENRRNRLRRELREQVASHDEPMSSGTQDPDGERLIADIVGSAGGTTQLATPNAGMDANREAARKREEAGSTAVPAREFAGKAGGAGAFGGGVSSPPLLGISAAAAAPVYTTAGALPMSSAIPSIYATPAGAAENGRSPLLGLHSGGASLSGSSDSTRLDGKQFFKRARGRLSYEQFTDFLANIKELNAGKQTREHTLHRARAIFGEGNLDLYKSFEGLLSRNMP